jgi:uridine kinase
MKKIIGLIGPAGSGKTTLANKLVSSVDKSGNGLCNPKIFSFADSLKDVMRDIYGITKTDRIQKHFDCDPLLLFVGYMINNGIYPSKKIEDFSAFSTGLKEILDYEKDPMVAYRKLANYLSNVIAKPIYGNAVWVDVLLKRIDEYHGAIIIDDLRYDYEEEALLSLRDRFDVKIFLVLCEDSIRQKRLGLSDEEFSYLNSLESESLALRLSKNKTERKNIYFVCRSDDEQG